MKSIYSKITLRVEKPVKNDFNRNILIALIILAVLGLASSLYAWREPHAPFDLPITLWFQSFDSPALRSTMVWVSYIFSSWRIALIVAAGAFILWRIRGREEAIFLAVAGIVSLIHVAIKLLIERSRPLAGLVQIFSVETTEGYPSGHALASILIFGFLLYLILTLVSQGSLRIISLIFFPLLILLIGSSRIFLGVHWTTDVLGGYIIGGFFLTGLVWLYERVKQRPSWINRPR
jgi:undecaprenyl-diphosphatase